VKRPIYQLPAAAQLIHTFANERLSRDGACSSSSSSSLCPAALQPVPLQLGWKTRSVSLSTHTDATITHVDTDVAPADTATTTASNEIAASNAAVYSDTEFQEMTQRYISINVADTPPPVHDLDRMTLCIHFWRKKYTYEAWKHSSQLFEQLLLALQHHDPTVLETWYNNNVQVPAMTNLLNAVLGQWRIVRERVHRRNSRSKSASPENSIIPGPSPLQMLEQLRTWKSKEPLLLLNAQSFSSIMQASIEEYNAEETPLFCESIFRNMIETQSSSVDKRTLPDARSYLFVMKAWSKCSTVNPEAMERLWNLFNDIQKLHKDGILKDPLDAIHYAFVIECLLNTRQREWMDRVDQLFQQMQESSTLIPDKKVYASYIYGWLTYEDLTLEQWHHCKAVLNEALERSKVSPEEPLVDGAVFARFMVAACDLDRDDLAEQTYAELGEWYKQFPVPSMAPDANCLKALILLYSRTLRPEEAEQALFNLIKTGHGRPKAAHFEMIIKKCWLKQTASDEDGLERAGQLLLRAVKLDEELRLNLSDESLYWIISAWAESGRRDAPARAAFLLAAFQSKGKRKVRTVCLQLVKKMHSPSFQLKQTTDSTS
jgi:hypothetical protein